MTGKKLTEGEILSLFRRKLGLARPHPLNIAGNADDAAIMPLSPELFRTTRKQPSDTPILASDSLVLTIDGMVEGNHFRLGYYTPSQVAAKCMAINLSDLAAMGAVPLGALVYVGLPKGRSTEEFADGLAEGLRASMRRYRYTIFGGDLTSANDFTISAAFIGHIVCASVMLRSGAKPGDTIYLGGKIGAASLGLKLLESMGAARAKKLLSQYPASLKASLEPKPQLEMGIQLAQSGVATSCIDLSDSLSKSLHLIAQQSKVGLEINASACMLHPEVKRYLGKPSPTQLLRAILSAEEDFKLLFTAKAESLDKLGLAAKGAFPIGKILHKKHGVHAIIGGTRFAIPELGFEHFGR